MFASGEDGIASVTLISVPELGTDSLFAGCRIQEVAGRGGMGIVYRATQLPLGRAVALKLVSPERAADPAFRARFERESRLAAAIDHPNVIPIYAAGEENGAPVHRDALGAWARPAGAHRPHRAASDTSARPRSSRRSAPASPRPTRPASCTAT